MEIPEHNHWVEDEELRCFLEARRLFKKGRDEDNCDYCKQGWALVDQAILAKYTTLAQEHNRRRGDAKTNGE